MAGLGSVEDRVSAYRGNPAPLQQRYAMSQDLLDLLALQKIKSEKEAAARDMQLKMGQQAAAQGDQAMTVAQQREKEVMDMTKTELAQQRGDTADQQVAQQQESMQKLMSGIARAPGAASAAQPVMMASGGIVAFDEGGKAEDPRFKRRENESFADYRRRILELESQLQRERDTAKARARETERQRRLAERGNEVIPPSPFLERAPLPTPAQSPAALATPAVGSGRGDAINPPMADPSAPMPQPPAPAPRQAPAAPAGLAGLPGAQGAPAAPAASAAPAAPMPGTAADPLAQALREQSITAMRTDPRARQLEEEGRIEGRLAFPDEQERRRRVIDEQRRMYEQEFDPERQRQEAMRRFMLGASGRRYGVLAGGSAEALDYETSQRGAQRQRLKGLEDMEQGLFSLRQGAVKDGIGAGQKAAEQASVSQRQGMETGRGVYATETQARDNALAREIDRLRVQAQNEANRISKEGVNLNRMQSLYATTTNRLQQLERSLDEDFAAQNGMLLMAEQGGKIDPAQKKQLDIARENLKMQKAALRKEMEPVLAPIRRQLGADTMSNLSAEDRALIEQYNK
jgi:hypothetical protein